MLYFLFCLTSYTEDNMQQVMDSVSALEQFLLDQKNHEKYCPQIIWEQPDIEDYKQDLKSHLPQECPVPAEEKTPNENNEE